MFDKASSVLEPTCGVTNTFGYKSTNSLTTWSEMSSPFSKFLKKNSASFANTSVPNPSSLPDLIASKIAKV